MNGETKHQRWLIFGVAAGLFVISMLFRAASAVIAPELSSDLSLSPDELGLLGAVFFYAFALSQLPLGLLLDRIGPKLTMVALNLLGVAGAVGFAMSDGLTGALISRSMIGLGMSANLMGPLKIFSNRFRPNEFASVSGMMVSVGSMGSLLATSPLAWLSEAVGWRGSFYILGAVTLVFTGLLLWVLKNPPPARKTSQFAATQENPGMLRSLGVLARNRNYWAIALAAGLRYGAFASIQTLWAGPFLMIYLGLPKMIAGNMLLMLTLGFILGAPVCGFLSDRVFHTRKWIMTVSLSSMAVCVLILSFWPGPVRLLLLTAVLFIFGFVASAGQLVYAHIKELMPENMSATAMTGVNFFVFVGAGVYLHGLGAVLERSGADLSSGGGYKVAFLACCATLAIAAVLYFSTKDSHQGQR